MPGTKFKSDGSVYAQWKDGTLYRVPVGWWILDSDTGELTRYVDSQGLSGFWSSIGSGFKSVGKWIGNNFGQIATAAVGIYAVHQGLTANQQGQGQMTAQQQAQAQANYAAQQAAQAQAVGGVDLSGLLPIAAVGVGIYLLAGNRG